MSLLPWHVCSQLKLDSLESVVGKVWSEPPSDTWSMFWQDAPAGHNVVVTSAKSADGMRSFCLKCTYVKRGSFKGLKQMQFLKMIHKNPQLKSKLPDFIIPSQFFSPARSRSMNHM